MQLLYDWLTGNMGIHGEYMYQPIHLISTGIVLFILAALGVIQYRSRANPRRQRRLILALSIFQLSFEVLWRLIYVFVKGDTLMCWWPLYPCNLNGILIPIIAIVNKPTGKKLFYLFAFVGAVLTFALPEGIFCTDVMVFPVLKSILQHTGILMIPLLELVGGTYRPTLRHMGWVIAGGLIHVLNSEILVPLQGFTGDYMFYESGLPFVIPGVSQYITLTVFAVLVLGILSFLCDVRDSRRFLRSLVRHPRHV